MQRKILLRILLLALLLVTALCIVFCLRQYKQERALRTHKVSRLCLLRIDMDSFFENFRGAGLLPDSENQKPGPLFENYLAYNFGTKPLGSWRMCLLIYTNRIEYNNLTYEDTFAVNNRYNPRKPYNEEPNSSFHYDLFCWNDNPNSKQYTEASVLGLAGKDTALEFLLTPKNHSNREESIFDIYNKCGSAILLIEAVDSGVHWGAPVDFEVDSITKEKLFPNKVKSILIMFADGAVWEIKRTIPMEVLEPFLRISTSKNLDRDKLLGPYGKHYRHV